MIFTTNNEKVHNLKTWHSLLQDCKRERGKNARYMAFKVNDDDTYQCAALENNVLGIDGWKKMSLDHICKFSKYISDNSQSQKNEIEKDNKIKKSISRIADCKSRKLNSLSHRTCRCFLKIIKLFLYASIIGIPVGLLIAQKLKNWDLHQKEIDRAPNYSRTGTEFLSKVIKKTTNEEIRKYIEDSIHDELAVINDDLVFGFKRDNSREGIVLAKVANMGTEVYQESDEDVFFPEIYIPRSEGIQACTKNKSWSQIIQATCTQGISNSTLGTVSSKLQKYSGDKYNYFLDSGINKISFNIIRNNNQNIKKLEVSSEITANLKQVYSDNHLKYAILDTHTFIVSFDILQNDNIVKINNFHSKILNPSYIK